MQKKKGKWGWFTLKIDLEKAYDRIEWAFVRECLLDLHLDLPAIDLIMSCISSASSRVLINGGQYEEFTHSRGLRQGDPMSPYLFNICLESLTCRINEACMNKDWTPFWVGRSRVPVSHLLFEDDLLLFGRVDEDTAFAVRIVLERFCDESGEKINEAKSKLIFSPNTQSEHKNLFMETLNICETKDLGVYLGLPISHKRPSRSQDCSKSRDVWAWPGMLVSINAEFKGWLMENMLSRDRFWDLPWGSLFPYLCHEIWKDRNDCVFNKKNPSPLRVIGARARRKVLDYIVIGSTSLIRDPLVLAHSKEFLMIHVDASFVGPMEVAGIGGVIRDAEGRWLWGFVRKIYTHNCFAAELLAILEALYLVEKYNLPKAADNQQTGFAD
ncbi:uncharacterized protein LOC125493826 [Beta vulgaris subsp. vulgaris]|uniref:uncharacterized protein LOC125493826 n=1 Tax=Beta vulgaris subsp. vulgaris TaxID=3555 RepID=UPI002036B429|nr:uncharacterized protein LOC125493826 [Beta vulgaris subsp. vulgaris]